MQDTYPYEPISPWWTEPLDIQPTLQEEVVCDVVAIGGGYTGLSTAINLARKGVKVVLLEMGICGSGSSGRNAGHLTPTIGKDMPSLLKVFGKQKAADLIGFAEEAVEYTESLIERCAIDCDYHPNGNIMAAVHSSQEKGLRRSSQIAANLGGNVEYLENSDMRKRGLPKAFISGMLDRCGGLLHPGKLVAGLRKQALLEGVRIFERNRVNKIQDGRNVQVLCETGSVKAEKAVLATNAYTASLGRIQRKAAPVIVTLLETAPLTGEQRSSLDWMGEEGVYTAHEILESYRLTSKNTIVAGSKQIAIPYGGKLISTNKVSLFKSTTEAFRDRFPELSDITIPTYWGGYIGVSLDFLPLIGITGRSKNIHYGIAYAGHGVAQAIFMGEVLSHRILGQADPVSEVLDRRTYAWPPEPLRWTGGQLLRTILTLMDKRVDRKIRQSRKNSQGV